MNKTVLPIKEDDCRGSAVQTVSRICALFAILLFSVIMLRTFFTSMVATSEMTMEGGTKETVFFRHDSLLFNLVTLLLGAAVLLICRRYLERLSLRTVTLGALGVVLVFGFLFVASSLSSPTYDSFFVSDAAYHASYGDYTHLEGSYFKQYPFQLGYVLFSEVLIRLFFIHDAFLVIEFFNVLFLVIAYYAIIKTVQYTFASENVARMTALFLMLFAAPILFCTFTYGNVPALMFGAIALWQMSAIRRNKWAYLHAGVAALCIGLAVMVKKNLMIFFAAMAIVLLIRFMRERGFAALACLLLSCVTVIGFPAFATWQYEARSGIEFGEGIPMEGWLAMGLHDSSRAPGWYNSTYTVSSFNKYEQDPVRTRKAALEAIEKRLDYFGENEDEAYEFFVKKIDSQWNETTYQSIWQNNVRGQYAPKWGIAKFLCIDHEDFTKSAMDIYAQILFAFTALGALLLLKKREIMQVIFPTIIIGGYLYHLLFEGKSQYVITYVILMAPIAAYGLEMLYGRLSPRVSALAARISPRLSKGGKGCK